MKEEFQAQAGRIAVSKAGRDKGRSFLIVNFDEVYAYVVDGSLRKIVKPKKKKFMHLHLTPHVADEIAEKLQSGGHVFDSDIRKALISRGFSIDFS